jgi:hypothetical protein
MLELIGPEGVCLSALMRFNRFPFEDRSTPPKFSACVSIFNPCKHLHRSVDVKFWGSITAHSQRCNCHEGNSYGPCY